MIVPATKIVPADPVAFMKCVVSGCPLAEAAKYTESNMPKKAEQLSFVGLPVPKGRRMEGL